MNCVGLIRRRVGTRTVQITADDDVVERRRDGRREVGEFIEEQSDLDVLGGR